MMKADTGVFVAAGVLVGLLLAGVYDLLAGFAVEPRHSASYWISTWSRSYPILPFVAGVICGHFWFQQ